MFAVATILTMGSESQACTSMIAGSTVTKNHRPMLWKHRDTGTEHNFIERVSRPGEYTYVALFNGGDTLLREAWMGMNEKGFAIMNTASYNLAPDTTEYKDREALVMSRALQVCATVGDFKNLLDTLPKPLGVQANFGVIDAAGGGAYFETDDYTYTTYHLKDTPGDYLIRTNYSFSGNDTDGFGYIRYDNACTLLADDLKAHTLTPASCTDKASKSFYHSKTEQDYEESGSRWIIDQDFIPRRISSASIVIEGVNPGESPRDVKMWAILGYPPCGSVVPVTIDNVPDNLRPIADGYNAPECNRVIEMKRKAFPVERGSGPHYIDMQYLRPVLRETREKDAATYESLSNSAR